jgi:hypothetical protein
MAVSSPSTHTHTHTHTPHTDTQTHTQYALGQIIIKEPVGDLLKWAAAVMLSIQPLHLAGNCKPGASYKYH